MPFDFAKAFQKKKSKAVPTKAKAKAKSAAKKAKAEEPVAAPAKGGFSFTKTPVKPERARGKGSGKHGLTKAQQIRDVDIIRSVGKFKLPSLKDIVDDPNSMESLIVIFGRPEATEQAFGNHVRNAMKDSGIKIALMQDDYWNEIEQGISSTITFEERMYRTIKAIRDVLNGEGSLEWKGESVMEAMLNYAAETGVLSDAATQLIPAFEIYFRSQGSNEKIPRTDNELRDWILKTIDGGPPDASRSTKHRKMHQQYAKAIYVSMLENFGGVIDDFFDEVQELIKYGFYKPIPMQHSDDVIRRLWSVSYVMNIQLLKINKLLKRAVALNDPYSTPKYTRKADDLLDRVNTLIKAFNSLPEKVDRIWARHDAGAMGGKSYNDKFKEMERAFDKAIEGLKAVHKELAIWDGTRKSGQKMMSKAFEMQKAFFRQHGGLDRWLKDNGSDLEEEMSTQDIVDTINDLLQS